MRFKYLYATKALAFYFKWKLQQGAITHSVTQRQERKGKEIKSTARSGN